MLMLFVVAEELPHATVDTSMSTAKKSTVIFLKFFMVFLSVNVILNKILALEFYQIDKGFTSKYI